MLASAGQPSLHGNDACMVYLTKEAPRGNCRQTNGKTSFSPFRVQPTDLLGALNSDCTKEFSGPATIVLGTMVVVQLLRLICTVRIISKGVFSFIAIGCVLHAEDHGFAASV